MAARLAVAQARCHPENPCLVHLGDRALGLLRPLPPNRQVGYGAVLAASCAIR
jgi:hypothetical protein